MAALKCEFTVPRRQAIYNGWKVTDDDTYAVESVKIKCFVWPIPTHDGTFVIEREDGRCQKVQPWELTFLGSKELFNQYDWRTDD